MPTAGEEWVVSTEPLPSDQLSPWLAGNSQYSQQQAGYQQGTAPQQAGYQQQYPSQQSYPGQQSGYGENPDTAVALGAPGAWLCPMAVSWLGCVLKAVLL